MKKAQAGYMCYMGKGARERHLKGLLPNVLPLPCGKSFSHISYTGASAGTMLPNLEKFSRLSYSISSSRETALSPRL